MTTKATTPNQRDLDRAIDRLRESLPRLGTRKDRSDIRRVLDALEAARSFRFPGPEVHATQLARDEALAAQLERAAKVADSSLLDMAGLRIRRIVNDFGQVRGPKG